MFGIGYITSNNRYYNCVLVSLKGSTHDWGRSSHRPFFNQCKPIPMQIIHRAIFTCKQSIVGGSDDGYEQWDIYERQFII